jgi:hypothetical protein
MFPILNFFAMPISQFWLYNYQSFYLLTIERQGARDMEMTSLLVPDIAVEWG